MIEATKSEWSKKAFYWIESKLIFPRSFKKIEIKEVPIKENHSVLLLMNHFSWWDGFLGSYLAYTFLQKSYHVMVQEDQLEKHWYFKYKGAYSIKKNSRELLDSIQYTQKLLSDSKNMVLIFPEGRLQSMHTDTIQIEKGVYKLIEGLPEKCQIIYCSVIIDYLESFKPTASLKLLDLGTTHEMDKDTLGKRINTFHQSAKKEQLRS